MADGDDEYEVVKWYTHARRFPQLIGKTADGWKIPGGPYTVTQALGAGIYGFGAWKTEFIWAHFGGGTDLFFFLLFGFLLVWGLGRIPIGSRNPLSLGIGAGRALFAPSWGRVIGKPLRLPRSDRIRHQVLITLDPPNPSVVEEAAAVRAGGDGGAAAAARGATAQPTPAPVVDQPQPAPIPTPTSAPAPVPAVGRQPALTGLQVLLATPPGRRPEQNEEN